MCVVVLRSLLGLRSANRPNGGVPPLVQCRTLRRKKRHAQLKRWTKAGWVAELEKGTDFTAGHSRFWPRHQERSRPVYQAEEGVTAGWQGR